MPLKSNRWYDSKPTIIKSVQILEAFPKEVQQIIAQGIIDMANNEFEASELMKSYKSMGSEKIMGLHKSQNKCRSLDQNPETYKAMSYMYVLSEENQVLMAQKIVEVSEFIYEYFKTCKVFHQDPSPEEINAITQTYVKDGSEETARFLSALENIVRDRKQEESSAQGQFIYEDSRQGMRISD